MSALRSLLAMFLLAFLCGAHPAAAFSVDDVRIGIHPDKTRIVFDLSEAKRFRAFTLEDPSRIVIDMPAFAWQAGQISKPAASPVAAIRQGPLEEGRSRIIVDLKQPVEIKAAFLLKKAQGKPDRLVIDIKPAGNGAAQTGKVFGLLEPSGQADGLAGETRLSKGAEKIAAAAPLPKPVPAPPPARPAPMDDESAPQTAASNTVLPQRKPEAAPPASQTQPKISAQKKRTIVIDPGHGGVDPGAIGANGVFEKHVSLAVGKELKDILEKTGRYRVLLTREQDTYLRLRQRVDFARSHEAALFVSLHADSIGKADVRGASIYTLSEKASDEQTARLADRENKADIIAGIDISHEDEQVANILIDIAMRDTMNQSRFLANTVMDGMKTERLPILETPHRSAGFAVLKAPDIPSVLIEMGFMSNKTEAQMLSSAAYHSKIAESIAAGIDAYFKKIDQENRI